MRLLWPCSILLSTSVQCITVVKSQLTVLMMGNVTSNLIETAIQSANSENDISLAHDSVTSDSSKLEVYRLLRERMSDTETCQKSPILGTDNNSSGDTTNLVSAPAKEHVMMAPKKKFLIGYRGDEDEHTCEKTGSGNSGGEVVAKVYLTPSSTSADVARSRSHTVSLPFRTRGPPQTQPEVPRRPLMEAKPVDAVRSGSGISSPCRNPAATLQTDATIKPQRAMVEPAAPITQLASVCHDMRPVQGGYLSVDKYPVPQPQPHQRLTPGSTAAASYSPRGSQQYHRDTVGGMEAAPTGRQMTHVVQHVRDRPTALADPGPGLVEHAGRYVHLQVSEPHGIGVKYESPVATHPVLECHLDRRFLPPGGTDRHPTPQMADRHFVVPSDRHFVVPSEYWKETAADDRRRVGRQMPDHREMRTSVGHDPYASQSSMPALHCVDRTNTVSERAAAVCHYTSTDNSLLLADHTAGSYQSRSAEFARAWTGQHPSVDSYRHSSGVVDLPPRESRAGRPHYDMGDVRKYPSTEAQMSTEYGGSFAATDVQYQRHQVREPVMVATGGGGTEMEHHYRRPGPHAAPLQPVEPCVRPRIAGLTHGDPTIYEPAFDSSRYPPEHTYRSSKYEVVERPRPSSDVLTQFVPSEPKQARRHSPYYSMPPTTRTSSGSSVTGLSSRLPRDSLHRVTSESPLDLTVRKEQSMTAEAFLLRCHNSSQSSGQYSSPSRHPTDLQYSSGYPSHYWTYEGFNPSPDMRSQRLAAATGTILTESSYPGHVGQRTGDAGRAVHSAAVREYPQHVDPDVHRHGSYQQHQRRLENDAAHFLYSGRETDPRWDSARQPVPSMTSSPVVKPTYWDGRYTSRPIQTNVEISEAVTDPRSHSSTASYVGDVGWMGDRSQYGSRPAKSTDPEPALLSVDHRMHAGVEVPLALSSPPPSTAASRRIPMVSLLGGKYSPSDILHLCCKVCGSTYGSLRSFRMHFAKAHGQEPTPENFTIQTISDARVQRTQDTRIELDSPPTLQMESLEPTATNVGRDIPVAVGTDPHKRNAAAAGVCEFPTISGAVKPRSVAEVQPIQKSTPTIVVDQGLPPPVTKPSPDEATKRCGEDRRLKCKKCGQFSTPDLSSLRQHIHDHGPDSSPAADWPGSCECADTLDSDTGCAVCLEGFNDVSDWQHHVTSQHMMRSCVCKSCDLGFTNASALRRHLTSTHGVHSPTGSNVSVEYRCLFCPEAFTDERSLYAHTRAHEQHYSIQRDRHNLGRGTAQMSVQMAVPDTTCSEDQKTSTTVDLGSLDSAAICTAEMQTTGKTAEVILFTHSYSFRRNRPTLGSVFQLLQ